MATKKATEKLKHREDEAGAKYGIWDTANKGWRFKISEDTPMLAMARLYQHIGYAAKRSCFEARRLPEGGLPNGHEDISAPS